MKKIIAIVTTCLISLSFISCNNSKNETYNALTQEIALLEQQMDVLMNELKKMKSDGELLEQQLRQRDETIILIQKQLNNLKGEPIEYTETKPIYGIRQTEKIYISFSNKIDEEYNAFNEFKDYILKDFCLQYPYDFFLLDPNDNEGGWDGHHRRKYYAMTIEKISDEGVPISPIINEQIMLYNEVLGDSNIFKYEETEGYVSWSLYFDVYLVPISQKEVNDFSRISLKFGRQNLVQGWNEYFNIYLGQNCIGTCYYQKNAYVSKTWLESFFINNLIRSN